MPKSSAFIPSLYLQLDSTGEHEESLHCRLTKWQSINSQNYGRAFHKNRFKWKTPNHSSCPLASYLQWISQRRDSQWLPLLLDGLVRQDLGWPHTGEALHWCQTLWFESCPLNQRNLTHYLCGQVVVQTSRCRGAAQETVWAICSVHQLEKPDNDSAFSEILLALPFQLLVFNTNVLQAAILSHATRTFSTSFLRSIYTELKKLLKEKKTWSPSMDIYVSRIYTDSSGYHCHRKCTHLHL